MTRVVVLLLLLLLLRSVAQPRLHPSFPSTFAGPIIAPMALLYFLVVFVVWKYQLLCERWGSRHCSGLEASRCVLSKPQPGSQVHERCPLLPAHAATGATAHPGCLPTSGSVFLYPTACCRRDGRAVPKRRAGGAWDGCVDGQAAGLSPIPVLADSAAFACCPSRGLQS